MLRGAVVSRRLTSTRSRSQPPPLSTSRMRRNLTARISLSSHRLRALTEKSWRLARAAITRLRDVSVVNAGTHSVLILYLSGSPASAKVKASSSKEMTVNFPSTSGNHGDSTVVGAATVSLDFVAGSNTVTISSNFKETPPDLDSIIVVQ